MADTITINVDGKDVQVPPRIQLIEALRNQANTDTPAFCYHQDLKVAGNCRICLVETEGPRGWALGISCHLQTAPGLKVRTQVSSEKIVKLRKGVMEFLLVNHPLDCPICDKAGECTLQEHYMGQGKHESRLDDEVGKQYKGGADHRFVDSKGIERGGKKIDLGPSIVLDQERCIVCTRCVRFMDDVAKSPQLGIAGRGDHAYLTTFPGEPLDHQYDLNTTDICPVGALTGKHFRFQQRVWMLKSVESIDPSDALGANLTIDYNINGSQGGKVWRLMPRRNPDVNKSWIANRTRLLYQHLAVNRLTDGRKAGADCTIEDATVAAIAALQGAKKVALVASGHLTTEDNAAVLALADALGAKAQVFGGSWLGVGKPDGIALSGDPVANRKGVELLGIKDNLDDLVAHAKDFDVLLVVGNDLWSANADKAAKLETIPSRIALASWIDATVAKATIAIGIRAWAEVRGSMVNCNGRVQLLQACPVVPNAQLEPAWSVLVQLSKAGSKPVAWTSEVDAWKAAQARVPAFAGMSYRSIGPMGQQIALSTSTVAAPATAGV
jgi:NADH-quinone oxidoreductase subunit G